MQFGIESAYVSQKLSSSHTYSMPCISCMSRQHESVRCPTARCTACGAFGCNASVCKGKRAFIRRIGLK